MQTCHACTAILAGSGCVFSPSDSFNPLATCKATIKQASLFRNWPSGNCSLQSPVVQGQTCQHHGTAETPTVASSSRRVPGAIKQLFPGHAHRPGPREKHSTGHKLLEFMHVYVASLLYLFFFKHLQDDQPAPATKSQLKLALEFKDEEWALQTAEKSCFLMIFFTLNLPPSVPSCARQSSNYQEIPSLLIYISMNAISEQPTVTGSYYFHRK